jgi:hypothetical protein
MKKILLMSSALLLATFFVACTGKTELQFTNSNSSTGHINNIVWADGDATWVNGINGYARNSDTDAKEVTLTSGTVTCQVETSDGNHNFVGAIVIIDGNSSLSIKSGASNKYTLQAN